MSCKTEKVLVKGQATLFGVEEDRVIEKPCEGCEKSVAKKHNGTYVKIMNWKEDKIIRFVDIVG